MATSSPPSRDNVDQVYRRLREDIVNGTLAPGSVVSQAAIAAEMGISRTPLREALRMLQGAGLVEAEVNRRVRISPITPSDLEQLCIIRLTLELEAVTLAITRLAPEDHANLEALVAAMTHYAQEEDYERWQVPHVEFHRGLTAAAGERINMLLAQLFAHGERYRRLWVHSSVRSAPNPWRVDEHRALLDACKARDTALLRRLMAQHITQTTFDILAEHHPDYVPQRLEETLAAVRR